MKILRRSSGAHLLRHPWQFALAVVGIALGVAVVVSVDLAVQSARSAFLLSSQAISGRATHEIIPGATGLPDSVFSHVVRAPQVRAAAPVVQGYVRDDETHTTLQVLGVDPFSEAPFRSFVAPDSGFSVTPLLTRQNAVLLTARTASTLGVAPGDSFAVRAAGRELHLHVAGVLKPADELSARALENLLLTDIAAAQEILGTSGRIDRIDLILSGDESAARSALQQLLPRDATVQRTGARARQVVQLAHAFDLNLTALSLLTLLFGMFLIYNSVTFSVVQRMPLLATLRTLGVTRREIFGIVVDEALVLGAIGTLLGGAIGVALGTRLVHLVTRTINDLYFVVTVQQLSISGATLLKAGLLGIGGTVLAAFPAAYEATRATPRIALLRSVGEARSRMRATRVAVAGLLITLTGVALLALPIRTLWLSLGAIFVGIVGTALLIPIATLAVARAARPIMRTAAGLLGRMAANNIAASLSRTAPAVAALSIAVAVGIAVGAMIESFRGTVVQWLEQTLQADIYISAPGFTSNRTDTPIDPRAVAVIAREPSVQSVSLYRNIVAPTGHGDTRIIAVDFAPQHARSFRFRDEVSGGAWNAFSDGAAVLASEPYAYRYRLRAGDSIVVRTPRGNTRFQVAGVFRDYASEQGVLFMQRRVYLQLWGDSTISSLAVFLRDGVSADAAMDALRIQLRNVDQQLTLRSSRALRNASLEVFDRTFAITAVLRLLALIVAFVGVLSALMALQLERSREIGILRASGMTPAEVSRLIVLETALLGTAAGAFAMPLGAALAAVMVHVVNRRSFGWTLDLQLPPAIFAQGFVLALVAAVAAGVYPALRIARTRPALALRDE